MTSKEMNTMKKMGLAQVIDGELVKVGQNVAVYDWLGFAYVIVGLPRANKLVLMEKAAYDSHYPQARTVEVNRCHKKNSWKMGYRHYVTIDFNPKPGEVEAHNKDVYASETWMCM